MLRLVEPGSIHKSTENKNLPGAGHTTSGFGFLEFLFVVLFCFGGGVMTVFLSVSLAVLEVTL